MGMNAILCRLSPKRHEQLEAEPSLLQELLAARTEQKIQGLLDLGKRWDALDQILSRRGEDVILGDAILARTGQKLRAKGPFGKAHLLPAPRVVQIAAALAALPEDTVQKGYPRLYGKQVHGNYGQEVAAPDDVKYLRDNVAATRRAELAELEAGVTELRALYTEASTLGHAVMAVVI